MTGISHRNIPTLIVHDSRRLNVGDIALYRGQANREALNGEDDDHEGTLDSHEEPPNERTQINLAATSTSATA